MSPLRTFFRDVSPSHSMSMLNTEMPNPDLECEKNLEKRKTHELNKFFIVYKKSLQNQLLFMVKAFFHAMFLPHNPSLTITYLSVFIFTYSKWFLKFDETDKMSLNWFQCGFFCGGQNPSLSKWCMNAQCMYMFLQNPCTMKNIVFTAVSHKMVLTGSHTAMTYRICFCNFSISNTES